MLLTVGGGAVDFPVKVGVNAEIFPNQNSGGKEIILTGFYSIGAKSDYICICKNMPPSSCCHPLDVQSRQRALFGSY